MRARAVQARDLAVEVALLLQVGGPAGGLGVGIKRRAAVAASFQEMGADSVEAPVVADARIAVQPAEQGEAGPGPVAMATATAWLSATTGLSSRRSRTP